MTTPTTLQSLIAGRWIGSKPGVPLASAIDGRTLFHTHAETLDFGAAIAMQSGMSRDPEQATSTLVALATGRMPEAVNRAGIVRDRATAGVLRGYLSDGDRSMIDASRQEVTTLLTQIDRQLKWIGASDGEVHSQVAPHFQRARDAFTGFSSFADQKLLKALRSE